VIGLEVENRKRESAIVDEEEQVKEVRGQGYQYQRISRNAVLGCKGAVL